MRLRGDRGDVLDVEDRLAAAGACRLAAVDRDHVQPLEHARGGGGAEVAGVERLDVRAREGLELVEGDVLAGAEVAAAVEPEGAVAVGDLVVGQAAEGAAAAVAAAQAVGEPCGWTILTVRGAATFPPPNEEPGAGSRPPGGRGRRGPRTAVT